jgi:hypothetical protein
MKLLTAILIILAIGVGLSVGLPILAAGLGLAVALGCLFIWLLPFLIIATSDKTTGGEKLAWLLVMIFLSWFAWIFYWLLAPLKPRDDYVYRSRHRFDRYDRDYRDRSYY